MSYNPNVHGKGGRKRTVRRAIDPHAGKKHSDLVRGHGPRGVNVADLRSRQNTPHGWKILYFEGEEFVVYYEYFCARNGTGVIRNQEHARVVRVLAGMIFLTMDSQILTFQTGQAVVLPKGTKYELATSGDTDAELLICEGPNYSKTVEQITDPLSVVVPTSLPQEAPLRSDRVDSERAKRAAEQMRAERKAQRDRRQPVATKTITNELGETVPAPSGKRQPLAGQQVLGTNPRPVGAGGYSE